MTISVNSWKEVLGKNGEKCIYVCKRNDDAIQMPFFLILFSRETMEHDVLIL